MQDLVFLFISTSQLILITMIKIVFCATLSSIFFFIVKLYARRGVQGAKQKDWSNAKQAFIVSVLALAIMAILDIIGFFEWLFYVILGGVSA